MVYRNSMDGIFSEPHPEHNINADGFCTYCGASTRPVLNNGVYEIKNLSHLQWFADYVNTGNTNINGKLMADIDVSSMTSLAIGISGKDYSGTFDGNGYTLTIGLDSTATYAAPFQYINGATIKNLNIIGTIKTSNQFAASIVGCSNGNTTIENCLSKVVIESTRSGDGTHGGLAANVSSGTMTINNCGFAGAINGSNTTNCGGLVGWADSTTIISNSFVAATFSLKSGDNYTFSRNASKVSLINCYYLNALGTAQGTQMTADQFASGEVAWLLNGSDNGTWKQTLGENGDTYPNFSGGAVYKITPCNVGYTNDEAGKTREHDDFNEQGFCKDCNGYQPAAWNNEDNVYEISNAGQLMWFAGLVNGTLGDVPQNQSANAILMADIDMSAVTDYVPIGGTTGLYYSTEGDDKGYQGTFDGNGHVIKNLSVAGSNTAQLTYGVFGTLSGTVKHLGVENFTFTIGSQDCRAGGIAGQILSGGLIKNCYVANSTITATGKVAGGIAGCNYAGTIQNCFTYKVTVTATRSGGIVGDNRGDGGADDRKGTIINCYTDASAIESSDRAGNVTASKANVGTTDFSSGLLAWSLNNESNAGVWKQTIGTNEFPCFDGNDLSFNTGDYADSDNSISLQIIWTSMEFTYYAGEWDASKHAYTGGGYWETDISGGGVISVRNTGGTAVRINLSYTSSLDGVTGEFDSNSCVVRAGNSSSFELNLSGKPTGDFFTDKEIGYVSIEIGNIDTSGWSVGDTVSWLGDDGKTYDCTIVDKTDDNYILMTNDYIESGKYTHEWFENWAESVGARLPNSNNDKEKNFLRSITFMMETYRDLPIIPRGGRYNYNYYEPKRNSYHNSSNAYFAYLFLVFEVPIS